VTWSSSSIVTGTPRTGVRGPRRRRVADLPWSRRRSSRTAARPTQVMRRRAAQSLSAEWHCGTGRRGKCRRQQRAAGRFKAHAYGAEADISSPMRCLIWWRVRARQRFNEIARRSRKSPLLPGRNPSPNLSLRGEGKALYYCSSRHGLARALAENSWPTRAHRHRRRAPSPRRIRRAAIPHGAGRSIRSCGRIAFLRRRSRAERAAACGRFEEVRLREERVPFVKETFITIRCSSFVPNTDERVAIRRDV